MSSIKKSNISFLYYTKPGINHLTNYTHTFIPATIYITRRGDARSLVAELDREQIWNYIAPHIKQKGR